MSKYKLIKLYRQRFNSFKRYFELTLKRHQMEDIHQLRVSIKKLRAVLRLMEDLDQQKPPDRSFRSLFKEIFKKAGAVREIQINLELTDPLWADHGCDLEAWRHQEQSAITAMLQALKAFEMHKLETAHQIQVKKINALDDQAVLRRAVTKALQELKKVISLKYQTGPRALHMIRIKLKAVAEIMTLIYEIQPQQELLKLLNDIKQLNQMIGDWHDHQILLEALNAIPNSSRAQGCKSMIQYFNKITRQQKTAVKKELFATVNRRQVQPLQVLS